MIVIILIGSAYYVLVWRSETTSTTTTTSTSLTSSSSTTISYTTGQSPSLGEKFIEIKAFDVSKGGVTTFLPGDAGYTATSLLSLIQSIHNQIGNFNLIRFIRVECKGGIVNPNLMAGGVSGSGYNWNGTLNSYFTAIQQAAGGQIIPDADMDIYFGQSDCAVSGANQQQYQQWYYQDASSLLTLSAIAEGQRYVMLESWDAYYVADSATQGGVKTFFQTMLAQGWSGFIPQVNNPSATGNGPPSCSSSDDPFSDYGYGGYVRNGLFWINITYPYVFPHYNTICSIWQEEPYIKGILLGIESQMQTSPANQAYCDGKYDSAGDAFEGCLTLSQREAALTDLAENQAKYNYIFIYPVLVGEHSIEYNAQQDGTLSLMEHLINEYN